MSQNHDRYSCCDNCWNPMAGIHGLKARTTCVGCGGKALNVRNETPATLEELAARIRKRRNKPFSHRTQPPPGKRRA